MSDAGPAIPENIPELPPAPPRESLIATAVKFLQNSKVHGSPLEQKKQFLTKKGLTDEEIEIAITRSGIDTSTNVVAVAPPSTAVQQLQPISTWQRIREYSAVAIIIGGVIYGLYSLYKRFIEPIFLRRSEIQEKKLKQMEEGIRKVNEELGHNMQEIRSIMGDLQEQLGEQSMKMGQVAANLTSYKAENSSSTISNSAIGELKAEITSIKGLLLSRNQFPSKPAAPPVIPSWQMKSRLPPAADNSTNEEEAKKTEQNQEMQEETSSEDVHVENGDLSENEAPENEGDLLRGKTVHMNGHLSDNPNLQGSDHTFENNISNGVET